MRPPASRAESDADKDRMSQRDGGEMLADAAWWDRGVANRLCVLVTGPHGATREFVERLRPRLPQPVIYVTCDEHLALGEWEAAGTIVLHDIDRLSVAAQWPLLERLDAVGGQTQVVSTSSRPLLPLITRGEFLATLYYQLNTIYIEVG